MQNQSSISYKDSGVDIDYASEVIFDLEKTKARSKQVIKSANDFAGLFSLKEIIKDFDDPILVSGTDGIGTKLLVAMTCNSYEGLGQDLVAMCANDIVTKGAQPLFFLDYFAAGVLKDVPFQKVVNGIVKACDKINCALIGGETAEMPGLYAHKHFDLAGFVVGVAEKNKMLGKEKVRPGQVLLGLPSSGLHSNAFSLVRKIVFEKLHLKPNDVFWQTEKGIATVASELLEPTKLYVNQVLRLLESKVSISAIAHITGGGIYENIKRIIPSDCDAKIDLSKCELPNIFQFLQEKGPIENQEMFKTFNMGFGMVLALDECEVKKALDILREQNESAKIIGTIESGRGECWCKI